MNQDALRRIGAWLLSGNCGISSETMLAIALGVDEVGYRAGAPYDYGDFFRCYRLVQQVPEIREHFPRIAAAVPEFAGVLRCWDELVVLCELNARDEVHARIRSLRKEAVAQ